MLKRKVMPAILVSLIALSSCAALTIKTWIIEDGELVHGQDKMEAKVAQGYRCYSEADDAAWRTELKIQRDCCQGAGP